MIAGLLLLTQAATAQIASLDDYIRLDTGKPSWTVGPRTRDLAELRLNGLTWHGDVWRHEIVIAGSGLNSDVAILNLTGDRMENTMDDFTVLFSKTCRLPVVTVYGSYQDTYEKVSGNWKIKQTVSTYFTPPT